MKTGRSGKSGTRARPEQKGGACRQIGGKIGMKKTGAKVHVDATSVRVIRD